MNRPETLGEVVAGVDAIVFTLGSDGQGSRGAVTIDYGGVRNVLTALNGAGPRIALMTSIGVTNRDSSDNRSSHAHDWKRRSERLVRASGLDYTIVRPGWFDYNAAGQQQIVMIQGDTRHSGSPADGAVARRQIARVLVGSLIAAAANRKTFEVTADGAEQADLEPVFAALDADNSASLDDVRDTRASLSRPSRKAFVRTSLPGERRRHSTRRVVGQVHADQLHRWLVARERIGGEVLGRVQ